MRPFHVEVPDLLAELIVLVRQVPIGRVTTYGDLASALGDVRAAVWVAERLNDPPSSIRDIAHRVVKLSGVPSRESAESLVRLAADSVPLNDGRVDLDAARYRDFACGRPLETLKREQERLAGLVRLEPLKAIPDAVAAVDVSYRSSGAAVAAYVRMRTTSPDDAWTMTETLPVAFPYIQGYLSYRELPVYARLLKKVVAVRRTAPVLLVDGNGILHPRRNGIASLLGILADHPTIGISKSLLCGTLIPDGSFGPGTGRVVYDNETLAAALPPSPRGKKPLFVSPGHRCTLDDAVTVVNAWRREGRLPEPIRQADALSREVARKGLEEN